MDILIHFSPDIPGTRRLNARQPSIPCKGVINHECRNRTENHHAEMLRETGPVSALSVRDPRTVAPCIPVLFREIALVLNIITYTIVFNNLRPYNNAWNGNYPHTGFYI